MTDEPPLSRGRTAAIVVGLLLGVLLAALDTTIVSAAIRTIADDLQGLSLQAWATTAYLITSTLSTPLYGKLGDVFGRKPMYLAAITIFLVGSVACATSTSMIELAAFRALQGAGTGGLISLALVIIADIAPGRQAAKYQTAFVSVFSTSNLVGPAIGGLLAAQASILGVAGWRWVFLVNLPVGLAALAVVARTLRNRHQRQQQRIDWWGTLFITVGFVPLLLVSSEGPEWGWASPAAIGCYLASFVGLIAFFLIERRMKDAALVPLRLFRERSFVLACLATTVVGAAMLGAMSLYPQYFQIVKGTSASTAGLLMIPVMVGLTVSSGVSAVLISKTGRYKIFPLIGIALMSVAMVLFCFVDADTSLFASEAYLTIFGLGLGLSIQPLILTAQNTVPAEDVGVATSLATFFQQMGGIIGTSVVIAAVFGGVVGRIGDAIRTATADPAYQAALRSATGVGANLAQAVRDGTTDSFAGRVLTDSTFIQQLDPVLARPFLVGFSSSITIGFLIGLVVVVGVVLMAFVRERPLAASVEPSGEVSGLDVSGLDADIPMVELTVPIPRIDWPSNDFERPPTPFQWFMPTMPGASIHGLVQHPDGSPLAGVTLVLMDLLGRQVDQYRTGEGGRFGLSAPAAGSFLLVATTIGHQPRALMVAVTSRPISLRLSLERSDQQHLSGRLPDDDPDSRPLPRVVRLDTDGKNRHVRREADEAS